MARSSAAGWFSTRCKSCYYRWASRWLGQALAVGLVAFAVTDVMIRSDQSSDNGLKDKKKKKKG